MGRLDGRVALVTGGSGGIGRATALELGREGADVAIQFHGAREAAEAVVRDLRGLGRAAHAFPADLTRPEECRRVVNESVAALGGLDVLAAFAGLPFRRDRWFRGYLDLTPEDFRAPLELDLLGSAYVTQAAIPMMLERGRGSIILVGSTPAITGDVVGIPYLLAKAGVLALARSLALAYGPSGIRVNALALGSIETEAMARLTSEEKRVLADEPAMKRWGRPEEVARVVAYLASDDAAYVTGSTLVVDGGYALR